jgi:hypothetical protein
MDTKHLVIDYKITLTLDATLADGASETAVLEELNAQVEEATWALGKLGRPLRAGVEDLASHVRVQSQDRELLRSAEGIEHVLSRNIETIRSEKDL